MQVKQRTLNPARPPATAECDLPGNAGGFSEPRGPRPESPPSWEFPLRCFYAGPEFVTAMHGIR